MVQGEMASNCAREIDWMLEVDWILRKTTLLERVPRQWHLDHLGLANILDWLLLLDLILLISLGNHNLFKT